MIRTIIVIYAVGVVGFVLPITHGIFIRLTPLMIIFSLAILHFYNRDSRSKKQHRRLFFYLFVFIAGFLVELWGVNTGVVFGDYTYGVGLGPKIAGTPPIIGLNWVLMICLTSAIFSPLKRNIFNGVVWPSLLMVGYDIIMEQVAPKMEMWSWKNDLIPLQNYIMWGVLALFFHSIRYFLKIRERNPMALPIFVAQTIFFLLILILS
ncbi:MAG: carotenoid biosynthesis protein [Fermentimonas sp.]|nr:carotenoid biosynthesis protein [Fermentimonas sp.]